MVLQGLRYVTFLGWVSGVLLLKSPKGIPEQAGRKQPFFWFVIALFVFNILIRLDFYMTHMTNLRGETMVGKFLVLSLLVGESCFDIYFRANLVLRAKIVIRFLKTLELDMKKFAPTLQLPESDRKDWIFSERLAWATFVFHFISAMFGAYWASQILAWSSSSTTNKGFLFSRFLPDTLYTVIFYFFGEIPVICSISVAFALVIVSTFHLLWLFYDFCESLEQQILIYNAKVEPFSKQQLGELDFSVFSVATTAMQMQQQKQMQEPLSTDKLVAKLEHLKMVCGLSDKVCGPLFLGLIVRAVYVLISTANSILLYENPNGTEEKNAKHYLDMFLFPTEVFQLWLLPLGAMFKRKISDRKEKLTRKIIFMTNLDARTDLRNVMGAFTEWDWAPTGGPGFFDVDRSLLSGVVSSLMTYVTIIFQLNSLPPPGEDSMSTVNNTRAALELKH